MWTHLWWFLILAAIGAGAPAVDVAGDHLGGASRPMSSPAAPQMATELPDSGVEVGGDAGVDTSEGVPDVVPPDVDSSEAVPDVDPPDVDTPPHEAEPPGQTTESGGEDGGSGEDATPGDVATNGPQLPARSGTAPAVVQARTSVTSIVLALGVLVLSGVLLRSASRRELTRDRQPPRPPRSVEPQPATTQDTLDFLLEFAEALVDAGYPVANVQTTVQAVARANGVVELGVLVLPTAIIISLPDEASVRTEVAPAGLVRLRLDQVDAVFRLADDARRGELGPIEGRAAIRAVRRKRPSYSPPVRLVGHVLFASGLVLLLRGGWLDLVVGAGLGGAVGWLQLSSARIARRYEVFLPVLAAFVVASVVFGLGRVLPDLGVFPPLVAPLVMFLPGAVLTTAVYELATGQVVSGAGRLAAGALQLVLLALGILAGAELLGVPAAAIDAPSTAAAAAVWPWVGVAVFGLGVMLFNGVRPRSMPWILAVLYVAYAGQVLGGLFFGSALSAFFGALALTPVAMMAARHPAGPPALVSFLPGFWLLVPGAIGLAGVTSFLDEARIEGVASLVTMGTSMVGITLGVLLGLATGGEAVSRLAGTGPTAAPRRPSRERVAGAG